MRSSWAQSLVVLLSAQAAIAYSPKPFAIEKRINSKTISSRSLQPREELELTDLFPEYNISVPVDHFHNSSRYEPHSNGTFDLRYYFDATYYKAGGPVIVLQSGETSAVGRLGFLQKGLIHQLAQATNGIAVVLEHRYYGTSWPTSDLSTESLRFLTTEQALADEAYFAQNVVFPGLEDLDLTALTVPWIGYGGSYAGAFNAFLRVVYPDVFWGTISSSGVVEAIYDYWTYWEPVRWYAPQDCISNIQKLTNVVDNILLKLNSSSTTTELKSAFGLPNVTYDDDFANVLSYGISGWQSKNWDPALNSDDFDLFCSNITSTDIIWPADSSLTTTVKDLLTKGGYEAEIDNLTVPMLNYIGFLDDYVISGCESADQDECFTQHNLTAYEEDDLSATWRSWPYQYCTEWGYLQTGSGVPADQLPLLSRLIDLEYSSLICVGAFNITTPPDVEKVNKYGGFNISYPRLAMIDGEWDPWRPATAHASPFNETAVNRTDTASEPFVLIPGAVHHWDENGLFPNETVNTPPDFLPPPTVRDAQAQILAFVQEWLAEWEQYELASKTSAADEADL
ncbi:serine carboxypeptidase S28 [Phlyctema vagabunda]|uniref:Serine carboxypeptidase S28 n=1 Tax=Phlyctema vagabunda TaxID=108571 RepID=A0ABR4PNV1_9HELO